MQGLRTLQELQHNKGRLYLFYQTQLEISLKDELRYSQVEELEAEILRGIRDCLSRFKKKTETTVPNKTTEQRGGRRFLLHIVTFADTSLIEGMADQVIDTLRLDWLGSVFILPKNRLPKIS